MKTKYFTIKLTILTIIFFSLFLTTGCGTPNVELTVVAQGFNTPTVLTHPNDGTNRLFVADQIGKIYIIEDGTLLQAPFLDISNNLVSPFILYDERGLLGLAFHPNYNDNGKFYVYYSAPETGEGIDHKSVVSEFRVSPGDDNIADLESEKMILTINQPEANHNAGQLAFGPDGYLYIGVGDGGGEYDEHGSIGNGQDITKMLGTILRIDVDAEDPYGIPLDNPFVSDEEGLDEIYAYGFRNPYKFSFGFLDGEPRLIAADVGQWDYEELNFVVNGGNYGWRIMEGNYVYDQPLADLLGINPNSLAAPFHEYDHSVGFSVIGGFVYNGMQDTELVGKYVFADWGSNYIFPSGKLFYLEKTSPDVWTREELIPQWFNQYITGMGEDKDGELYILTKTTLGPVGKTGGVSRIDFLQ